MHISGKILTWLIVVLALVAIALTAKVYDVRNSWGRVIDTTSTANQKRAEDIESKARQVRELQAKYDAEMRNWGPHWFPVTATVGQDGSVTLTNLGSDHGLGRTGANAGEGPDAKPVVYLFAVQQDGSSSYVGSFNVAQLGRTTTVLAPTWLISPDEPGQWNAAAWRVRTSIPGGAKERIAGLRSAIVTAVNYLQDKQQHLAVEDEAVQEAQKILQNRIAELTGEGAAEGAPGLVAEIAEAEDARNQELAELDRLRRQVQQIYAERTQLQQQLTAPTEQVSQAR